MSNDVDAETDQKAGVDAEKIEIEEASEPRPEQLIMVESNKREIRSKGARNHKRREPCAHLTPPVREKSKLMSALTARHDSGVTTASRARVRTCRTPRSRASSLSCRSCGS